jgi:hypothetical protein
MGREEITPGERQTAGAAGHSLTFRVRRGEFSVASDQVSQGLRLIAESTAPVGPTDRKIRRQTPYIHRNLCAQARADAAKLPARAKGDSMRLAVY